MKRFLMRWLLRSSLQMIVLSYSPGILANEYQNFMEYEDIDTEQLTYEKKINAKNVQLQIDPAFHNDSYIIDQSLSDENSHSS